MAKKYTLNEYYPYADNCAVTRTEVYEDNDSAVQLLIHHKQNGAVELSLSDCVRENVSELPMPDVIMTTLDERIKSTGKRAIVTGIDAYLSLLNESNANNFMVALHSRIDEAKLNVTYMVSSLRFDKGKFLNPKYIDSFSVVYIVGSSPFLAQATITVVSGKWVQADSNPTNWNALLNKLGQFEPSADCTLVLSNYKNRQAGLSNNVTQLLSIADIAASYYNISAPLPECVLETLITMCKMKQTKQPNDVLRDLFGAGNTNTRLAVKRLLDLQNDDLWIAFVWYLKTTIDGNSYFAWVLNDGVDKDNLLRKYVTTTASALLSDINATNYATERRAAIKEIGALTDSLIIEFIDAVKAESDDKVAPWLNCGTEAERIEIVSRVSKSDLTIGLPNIWHNLYSSLADYLTDQYDYGDIALTDYFRLYRRLKVANCITDTFTEKAYDAVVPAAVSLRDSVLQDLSLNASTALLVVDGMGAEYYPLLLSMAKRRGVNVQFSTIAAVRLPSSTEYNKIQWDASRCLDPSVHEVDNISHNGAKKHECCSPAHNIVATLSVFDDVFNRVAIALTTYDHVVVTADHGSSRLAVLAYEQKLTTTLKWSGEPQDWRFSTAPKNTKRPTEFESAFDTEHDITYWVVRGYNRLPKKGGKLSVHGGATLEERLVPVVVFSKNKPAEIEKPISKMTVEQLIEKKGFDEI